MRSTIVEHFLDEHGHWHCQPDCGACCYNVEPLGLRTSHIVFRQGEHTVHTHRVCEHLDDENKCRVYGARPAVCRLDTFTLSDHEKAMNCALACWALTQKPAPPPKFTHFRAQCWHGHTWRSSVRTFTSAHLAARHAREDGWDTYRVLAVNQNPDSVHVVDYQGPPDQWRRQLPVVGQ